MRLSQSAKIRCSHLNPKIGIGNVTGNVRGNVNVNASGSGSVNVSSNVNRRSGSKN
jgi:hypothetical protein